MLRWNNSALQPDGIAGFCKYNSSDKAACKKKETLQYTMHEILDKYVFFATHLGNFTEREEYIIENYAKYLPILQQKVAPSHLASTWLTTESENLLLT